MKILELYMGVEFINTKVVSNIVNNLLGLEYTAYVN